MPRYNITFDKIWTSGSFRRLSSMLPSGQALWFYLLNCPHRHGSLPGLMVLWPETAARDLRWSMEDFERCWAEVEAEGMAKRDLDTGLVWLVNSLKYYGGISENNVYGPRAGWLVQVQDLPPCKLRDEAVASWGQVISSLSTCQTKKTRRSFSSDTVSVPVTDPVHVIDPVIWGGGGGTPGGGPPGTPGGSSGSLHEDCRKSSGSLPEVSEESPGSLPAPALMDDLRPMGEERDQLLEVCAEYGRVWGVTPPDLPGGDHRRRFLGALRSPVGGRTVLLQAVRGHHVRANPEGSKTGKELRHVVPAATDHGRTRAHVPDMDRVLEYAALGGGPARAWTGR